MHTTDIKLKINKLQWYLIAITTCLWNELMKILKKKKKKKKSFFFFYRETPTSWAPFRAKFRPLGRLFRPSRPLGWALYSIHFWKTSLKWKENLPDALL